MWDDITGDDSGYEIRQTDDIEALLNEMPYKIGRSIVMLADKPAIQLKSWKRHLKRILARLTPRFIKNQLR